MSSESNFSVTVKTTKGSLLTVRGDTIAEATLNLQQAVINELAANVTMLEDSATGGSAAPTPAQVQVAPAAPSEVSDGSGMEVQKDTWGNSYTYNHPDAPALPDGRGPYVLKDWITKSGDRKRAWVDPTKGPKPVKPGASEARAIWHNG